jgi:hypothetical protein
MKKFIIILITLIPLHNLYCQIKNVKWKGKCTGTFWVERRPNHNNHDSILIFGTIKRVDINVETDPYGYIIIGNKQYKADREGNFIFKIKPGKYSIFAKNLYTYGLNVNPMDFVLGVSYEFRFYLKALPAEGDFLDKETQMK